jgi:hypothetical protein
MLELTIYGLMGLAATLVIAFYFAYGDEFPPAREKSSFDLVNNGHLNDSQVMETGTDKRRFRGTVIMQQRTAAPASLPQTTSPSETGPAAIYSDSFQKDRGQGEAFHG